MIEFKINGVSIAYEGEEAVRITKKGYDPEHPEERWSDYSKTIRVPGTAIINNLFTRIFEVNLDIQNSTTTNYNPDFNPNLKSSAVIVVDGIQVISGFAQMLSVSKEKNGDLFYDIQIVGKLGDFFGKLGEKKLTDLDLSAFDLNWTKANVEGSWTATPGSQVVFPMVDYGTKAAFNQWQMRDFFPAVPVVIYLNEIFAQAGFTYSSAYFASTFFKKLIILFSGENLRLTNAEAEERCFLVTRATTDQVATFPAFAALATCPVLIFNSDTGGGAYNTLTNAYNTSTGKWTVDRGGTYGITAEFDYRIKYTGPSRTAAALPNVFADFVLVRKRGSVYTAQYTARDNSAAFFGVLNAGDYTAVTHFSFGTNPIRCEVGDEFWIAAFGCEIWVDDLVLGTVGLPQYSELELKIGSAIKSNLDLEMIIPGDLLSITSTIPPDISQKDFFVSLLKMANLFVEPEMDNPLNLIIEPYDEFFVGGAEDLTLLWDKSQPFILNPAANLQGKEYRFEYKEDGDDLNKSYFEATGETYGTYRYLLDTDFQTEVKKIGLIFSPTPSSVAGPWSDRIIPTLRFKDSKGVIQSGDTNIRIVYFAGTKATQAPWTFVDEFGVSYPMAVFPSSGHMDDPYNPTIDLSFGVPRLLFYKNSFGLTQIKYTDNNLFNKYWKKYINELTHKNSKFMECHVYLPPSEYYKLSFRKTYFINEAYYRLLEVSDHDVEAKETTLCKFVKLHPGTIFEATQVSIFGGGGQFPGGEKYPGYDPSALIGDNTGGTRGGVIQGVANNVGQYGMVIGNDNLLGGVQYSAVFGGNNNEIMADRVVVINSDGEAVGRPNSTIINGIYAEERIILTLDGTEMANLATTPVDFLPALPPDQYYEIMRATVALTFALPWGGPNPAIRLVSTVAGSIYSSLTTGIFNALGDVTKRFDITNPTPFDCGDGVTLLTTNDVTGGVGNICVFRIYYRIYKC